MPGTHDRVIRLAATFVASIALLLVLTSGASAAGISVTPNTNDVVGLKSNDPTNTAYPNTFPLGAKVCNTTLSTITGVTASVTWGAATGAGATNISIPGATSISLGTLTAGSCLDAYYTIAVTRAAASFDSTRVYTVSATATGGESGSSAAGHRIYVEKLISQNRNNTRKIAGAGGCNTDLSVCDPAPANLVVGHEYTFRLYGDTATSQNTVEAFLDFPDTIFRVLSANSTASNVTGAAVSSVPSVFNDACQLQWNYTLAGYKGCTVSGGAGGNYSMRYKVRILSAGSGTLKAIIYDGSSGNWHLNSDYGSAGFTSAYVARWPLSLDVTGGGNVTSAPTGVDCGVLGATCEGAYANNTSVTLTAAPSGGEAFQGWSGGGCSGVSLTCTVTMDQARSVSASFTGSGKRPLLVGVSGLGSVSSSDSGILACTSTSGICNHAYDNGTSVTLTATPSPSQSFAGWSGGGCSGLSLTCTVTVSQATSVTASFTATTADSYGLTVQVAGSGRVTSSMGGINCETTCDAEFASGASVTLTATAGAGYMFGGWSGGSCSGTVNTCTVTMDQVRFVKATFGVPYDLTVSRTGAGSGNVTSSPTGIDCGATCQASFVDGTSVTLTASADSGSAFAGWSGSGCSGTSTCVVSMTQARSVTANFIAVATISVEKSGSGSGVVTSSPAGIGCGSDCSEVFEDGTVVELSAVADSGSVFAGWSGAGCSGTDTCEVTVGDDATVTATFLEPPTPAELPEISGQPYVGRTLSASDAGPWTGSEPITLTYQWLRCDSEGANCVEIEGADGSQYDPTPDDVGGTIRVAVTGTNEAGATTTVSDAVGVSYESASATTIPTITGVTTESETLTADDGEWTGSPTITLTRQWQRCDENGDNCVDIDGATNSTLLLVPDDVGHTIRVVVTATNPAGDTEQSSMQTDVVIGRPPVNDVIPAITGSPVEGQTLTGDSGTWTGTAEITYEYQWFSCDENGDNCEAIDGADESSYTVVGADAGRTLRLQVTATNVAGTESAMSDPTEPVTLLPPDSTAPPVISGPTIEGETLTTTDGEWAGTGPFTYEYQWQRCDADGENCEDIVGADEQSYVVTTDDIGHKITVRVTATNGGGSTSANADPVGPVAAKDPVVTGDPSISGDPEYGAVLTLDDGDWTSPSEIEFSRKWYRCDGDGEDCVEIDGETGGTYDVVAEDVGKYICASVTATNETGETTVETNCIGPITGVPPTNIDLPVVTGDDNVGDEVSVDTGDWDSYQQPPTYTYEWLRCDDQGDNCVVIDDEESSTYTLVTGDVGHMICGRVTATNDSGSTSAQSTVCIGPVPDVPVVETLAADTVTSTGAKLHGTVDPRYATTSYHFEWNADGGPVNDTPDGSVPATAVGDQSVSATLTGLEPETQYTFRIVADNRVDSATGEYLTFTTPAVPVVPPVDPPVDPPVNPPAPPVPFTVQVQPDGHSQEKMSVSVQLPGAGGGTVTGRVRDDARHKGAENAPGKVSKRVFTVFKQKYSSKSDGNIEFRSKIRGRALKMLRERGYLRIFVTIRYKSSSGGVEESHKQVIQLRPFAITKHAFDRDTSVASASIRTPRPGKLRVEFLLRGKGGTTAVKTVTGQSVGAGSFDYTANLNAAQRAALASGKAKLLVKATLSTTKYPAKMWRSRQIAY